MGPTACPDTDTTIMLKLVLLIALAGLAFAAPDASIEADDVAVFRTSGGALVKLDSEESEGVKAFRYSYPVHSYTYKAATDDDNDNSAEIIAPVVQTYAVPEVKAVGFKPLFTGYKGGNAALFPVAAATVPAAAETAPVDTPAEPIAEEYSAADKPAAAPAEKKPEGTVAVDFTTTPLIYTAPSATINTLPVTSTFFKSASPLVYTSAGFPAQYYAGSHAFTYSAHRPFFYSTRFAPYYSNVVTAPHFPSIVIKEDD